MQEFIALARAKPGTINFGTAGPGTLGHLGGEMMKRLAKIDIVHVPYKGGVLAIQDLLGNHVQFEEMGVEALSGTPEALRDFVRSESDKWGKLIKEAGIRAD